MMTPPLLRYFWFHSIYSHAASCSLQSAVCSLRSAVCSLRSAVCGLQSTVCSLQSANVIHRGLGGWMRIWIRFSFPKTLKILKKSVKKNSSFKVNHTHVSFQPFLTISKLNGHNLKLFKIIGSFVVFVGVFFHFHVFSPNKAWLAHAIINSQHERNTFILVSDDRFPWFAILNISRDLKYSRLWFSLATESES